mgnify:CR=1 FL=1|jgi:Protein of unknown function (DUF1579).
MKKTITLLAAAMMLGTALLQAQDNTQAPEMPKPVKEHEWLKKFAGEWTCEGECLAPDGSKATSTGEESTRMLGDFWAVTEGSGEGMGMPFSHVFVLGYDPVKKKYVGTWVDSMTGKLWLYEGTVENGKLTLETAGDCPMTGKHLQFRDEITFPDPDTKVFTSSVSEDGETWVPAMTMTAKRKK